MKQLTKDLAENQKKLDELLGVGRNYDVISRDLYIGAWKGRLYVIDGYGDDGVIERITSFLLGERPICRSSSTGASPSARWTAKTR